MLTVILASPLLRPSIQFPLPSLCSGLDNSPMYDGEFFNTTTNHMMLYDFQGFHFDMSCQMTVISPP